MHSLLLKSRYCFFLLLLASGSLFAQQEAMYSQYMFNMMAVNPAYAGSREVLSITGLARAQWVGLEGAPVSNTLSLDMPIKDKRVGLGAQVFNDKIGIMSNSGFYGSYAYRIRFQKSTLSFGLQGGFVHFTANYAQVRLSSTPSVVPDKAFQENASIMIPSAGAGLFLNNDNYYVGASLPNLLNTQISSGSQVQVNKYDHLFLMGGYVFNLNSDFKLKPSALLKVVSGAPIQLDANVNLWMYDVIALGISYRTGDAAVAMVELQAAPNFKVGYAYDQSITALRYFHSGSHEIMLRYEFGYKKDKIITPRYF
ncbi:MAG: type IX secretion system membrane protein PorP/SprF [Bacteroidota bacterium]